ncbi:TrmB family transcriptional regulator [Haloplanus rubicundus]|uniref:TrmB family transcriptional regulator n=1 Tax=Haloplanus rubicundus TaxID=1547898 RepID=A0A345EB85_9EURY|nr:helix-turn-helix domain-containing protein [Haloplanus rubicundus]AXG09457.1 TrmB family transcriptional regulator [Haloplanus rubicundus]
MNTHETVEEAVEVLQQLGLKEYEAKCFVGLSRLSTGTAKQLSEITDVPRTRVYDAVRVLEAQGLVEVQHSSPQRFRAVPLEEATETLRDQYEARVDRLTNALEQADPVDQTDEDPIQEVWSMSGTDAIANRSNQLIGDATDEVVLVLGDESLLTEELIDSLIELGPEVDLLIGAVTEALEAHIHDAVPNATTFLSGLDWLRSGTDSVEDLAIGRLLLVDGSTILVSTLVPETGEEQAIFGGGFRNGLVVISRRLLAQGLLPQRDPHPE